MSERLTHWKCSCGMIHNIEEERCKGCADVAPDELTQLRAENERIRKQVEENEYDVRRMRIEFLKLSTMDAEINDLCMTIDASHAGKSRTESVRNILRGHIALKSRAETAEAKVVQLAENIEKSERQLADKTRELEELTTHIEQGFAKGSYARLKELQETERQLTLTRAKLEQANGILDHVQKNLEGAIELAEGQEAAEKLGGNAVKEAYWSGELFVLRHFKYDIESRRAAGKGGGE